MLPSQRQLEYNLYFQLIKFKYRMSHQKIGWVNSFHPQQTKQSKELLKYLNSEQSQEHDEVNREELRSKIEQKYYLCCPELYQSYRRQHCIEERMGDNFTLRRYSQGRNELYFSDIVEIEVPNIAKLTVWRNGDYKLIYNEQVYFWHQEQFYLDKYCVTI